MATYNRDDDMRKRLGASFRKMNDIRRSLAPGTRTPNADEIAQKIMAQKNPYEFDQPQQQKVSGRDFMGREQVSPFTPRGPVVRQAAGFGQLGEVRRVGRSKDEKLFEMAQERAARKGQFISREKMSSDFETERLKRLGELGREKEDVKAAGEKERLRLEKSKAGLAQEKAGVLEQRQRLKQEEATRKQTKTIEDLRSEIKDFKKGEAEGKKGKKARRALYEEIKSYRKEETISNLALDLKESEGVPGATGLVSEGAIATIARDNYDSPELAQEKLREAELRALLAESKKDPTFLETSGSGYEDPKQVLSDIQKSMAAQRPLIKERANRKKSDYIKEQEEINAFIDAGGEQPATDITAEDTEQPSSASDGLKTGILDILTQLKAVEGDPLQMEEIVTGEGMPFESLEQFATFASKHGFPGLKNSFFTEQDLTR